MTSSRGRWTGNAPRLVWRFAPDGRPGWLALAFRPAFAAAIACSTSSSTKANWSGSIFSDRGRSDAAEARRRCAIRRSFLAPRARDDRDSLSALASSGSGFGEASSSTSRNQSSARGSQLLRIWLSNHETAVGAGYSHPTHPRPVEALDQRGELRGRQPHDAVADRRPAKRPFLKALPIQNQARPVPGQDLQPVRTASFIMHPLVRVRAVGWFYRIDISRRSLGVWRSRRGRLRGRQSCRAR